MSKAAWAFASLNEHLDLLTDFEANGSFKDVKENVSVCEYPEYAWYVRATDLENKTNLQSVKYVNEHSYNFLKKTKLYGNEVLVTKRGEIGKVYFFESTPTHATLAPNLYLLKLKESIHAKFLFYYFKSDDGQQKLKGINASTTMGALYKDDVKKLQIPTPPKVEQQKIASILSSVDRVIDLTETEIEKLKNLKKGMMQDLLTKGIGHTKFKDSAVGRIPESWEVSQLKDCSSKITNGVVGSATPYYTSEADGVPYIRGLNVRPNRFDSRSIIYITKEFHQKQKKTILKAGDLLTVQSGHNGQTCVVPEQYEGSNLHAVILTSLDQKRVNPYFASYFINSDVGMNQIEFILTGTTVMHINTKDFKKFPIPIPSLHEQSEIVARLQAIDNAEQSKQGKLGQIKMLKSGLMQDLLTGKVRVKV